jgi:predicted amidohydrolase
VKFKAACIQVTAGRELSPNIEAACGLAREARAAGADLVLMPENVAMMEWGKAAITAKAMPEPEHIALAAFRDLARETGLWLHCGTLAVLAPDGRVANRAFVIAPDGAVVASYDKIHMFDVDLPNGESYRESATFAPGQRAVIAQTPWGGLGLTICYDLRFPHLFRSLAKAGASFITVPAAFTRVTGMAHWHLLLRARAIETGAFIFAPAQTGKHETGRETYGHALIVAPWGEVLGDAGEHPGFVMAEIDTDRVAEARGQIPCLMHDRAYDGP